MKIYRIIGVIAIFMLSGFSLAQAEEISGHEHLFGPVDASITPPRLEPRMEAIHGESYARIERYRKGHSLMQILFGYEGASQPHVNDRQDRGQGLR